MSLVLRSGTRTRTSACISVQEARKASTLQRRRERCDGCGGGDRMACLLSLRNLVCDRIFGAYACDRIKRIDTQGGNRKMAACNPADGVLSSHVFSKPCRRGFHFLTVSHRSFAYFGSPAGGAFGRH